MCIEDTARSGVAFAMPHCSSAKLVTHMTLRNSRAELGNDVATLHRDVLLRH